MDTKRRINLQLFADGGEGSGGSQAGVSGGEQAASGAASPGFYETDLGPSGADVIENGAEGAGETGTPVLPRDRDFEKLIKGPYKEAFSRRMQEVIDKRFREAKGVEAKMARVSPLVERMAAQYGLDPADTEGLSKAFEREGEVRDRRNIRDMSPQEQKAATQRGADRLYQGWMREAQEVEALYPAFDLAVEARNSAFVRLLTRGLDVRSAYEVAHRDEILGSAMRITAQKVAEKVVNNIRARANRPDENGLAGRSGQTFRQGAAGLTREERARIADKAARGERVVF